LVGNAGNDTIKPAAGDDTIVAGTGTDVISFAASGLTKNDSISGTSDDIIELVPGGTNVVDFDRVTGVTKIQTTALNATSGITIEAIAETTSQTITITSLGAVAADDLTVTNNAASSSTTFSIVGAAGQDVLNGSSGNDTISGGAETDTINGVGGNNSLVGGAAADAITTNTTGTDTVQGGAAADQFVVTAGTMNITDFGLDSDVDLVDIAAGATVNATVIADWADGTDVDSIDNQSTGVANAVFTMGDGIDINAAGVTAGKGVTMTAASNPLGSAMAGTSPTGATGDSIVGGSGADTITGNTGNDTVTGNGAADTFHFAVGDTPALTVASADVITDYATGVDVISDEGGNLVIVANAKTAAATRAAISATGVATFHVDDNTFAERIAAVNGAQADTGAAARSAAVFAFDSKNYLYTGDGAGADVGSGYLVELTGVTISTGITIAGGDITAIA
jgi:Ca2+-binding RTX toxin-like protein